MSKGWSLSAERVCVLTGSKLDVKQDEATRKVMTKLPAKLFADFSRAGALTRILCCALRYKKEQVRDQMWPRRKRLPAAESACSLHALAISKM